MYILVIDQGTTNTKAVIVDDKGKVVACESITFKQYFPKPLWIEHDAEDIYNSTVSAIQKVLQTSKIDPKLLKALGITNQRETTVIWDKKTTKPVYNAIVWQDRRTEKYVSELKQIFDEERLRKKTGLLFDPYFSASKIRWILDHCNDVKKNPNNYLFGTIESYLVYKLTGGKHHITDITNASRTLLFNIETLMWDEELLELFDIPNTLLPQVVPNIGNFGKISTIGEVKDLPITSLIGDQQAALFGHGCFEDRDAKCTYGTGCFVLVNTKNKRIESKHRLLTTVGYQIEDNVAYALEGSVFMGGATVQWLKDELHFFETSKDIEKLALSVEDSLGVVLVPSFTGLGAPYWVPNAKGMLLGLTRGTKIAHIARATLQSIALQVCDIFEAMESDMGHDGFSLKVDGGGSEDMLLMQMQADYQQTRVDISTQNQVTALGAALLAGMGIGIWKSLDDIKSLIEIKTSLTPRLDKDSATQCKNIWKSAIECAMNWAKTSRNK